MSSSTHRVLGVALLVGVRVGLPSCSAQEGIAYDLRQGSGLSDDCLTCGRAEIPPTPITGSFVLTREGMDAAIYRVTDLKFEDARGIYTVTGKGSYAQDSSSGLTQEMNLQVEVNGVPGINLSSEMVEAREPWPLINILVTEHEPHDSNHVYTLRIVAAPRVELVSYELGEESEIVFQRCAFCRGDVPVSVPLKGTFLLGEVSSGTNPVALFRVDAIAVLIPVPVSP